MSNEAFHKLWNGFNATYEWNEKFREYVDENFVPTNEDNGIKHFCVEDMKTARKFWKQNEKKHPNYPWFNDHYDAYIWIDNMPFGGYEY